MNRLPENQIFGFVQRLSCSNHRRDDAGWPLGNCIECASYRKQMDAWYMAQVVAGEHRPGTELFDTDQQRSGHDDYSTNPKQSST